MGERRGSWGSNGHPNDSISVFVVVIIGGGCSSGVAVVVCGGGEVVVQEELSLGVDGVVDKEISHSYSSSFFLSLSPFFFYFLVEGGGEREERERTPSRREEGGGGGEGGRGTGKNGRPSCFYKALKENRGERKELRNE